MATALAHRKCLNHASREAAALCPECGSSFCRECIVEHAGVVLCSRCLAKSAAAADRKAAPWHLLLAPIGALAGLGLAWAFFLGLGGLLLRIPSTFHDGSWFQDMAWPEGENGG